MAGAPSPPTWSHRVTGKWLPYPATVCEKLEEGFVAMQDTGSDAALSAVVEVDGGSVVDLRAMVQLTAAQHAAGHKTAGETVMRGATSASLRVELLAAMFEKLADSEAVPTLIEPLTSEEMKQLRGKLGPVWLFDEVNPGGRYGPLALADSRHRRTVELLLLREAKERAQRQQAGVVDLGRMLRFKLNGETLKSLTHVPRRGMLEADFTTSLLNGELRNSPGARKVAVVTAEELVAFRQAVAAILGEKAGSEDNRMGQIRSAMKGLFFHARDVMETASALQLSGERLVDLLCVCWGRTVDVGSFQTLALAKLAPPERLLMHQRLGILFAFDPEHPDGVWKMNLTVPEERSVAEMMVILAVKEPGENWAGESWTGAAGEGWEVPASWIEEIPAEGVLTLTFISQRPPAGDICATTRAELSLRTFAAESR